MPMTVELVISMLAAARIGAIHSVVFAGFSSDALAERIVDAKCRILVTADGVFRGKKFIPLKDISDEAVSKCLRLKHRIENVIVYHHLKCPVKAAGIGNGNNHSASSSTSLSHTNGNASSLNGIITNGFTNGSTNGSVHTSNGVTPSKPNGLLSNGLGNGSAVNGSVNSSLSLASSSSTANGSDSKVNGYTNGVANGFSSNGVNGKTTQSVEYPEIPWDPEVDVWWHEIMAQASDQCEPVWVDAEDPLFILYTRYALKSSKPLSDFTNFCVLLLSVARLGNLKESFIRQEVT